MKQELPPPPPPPAQFAPPVYKCGMCGKTSTNPAELCVPVPEKS